MKKRWMILCMCCTLFVSGCSIGKTDAKKDNLEKDNNVSVQEQLPDTEIEAGIGEGTSSAELGNLNKSEEYSVGDKIIFSSEKAQYELTIEEVESIEPSEKDAKAKNVRIKYSYTNKSEEPLLVGDIRFQLTNKEKSTVYKPYYSEELSVAEAVEKDKMGTGQIEFSDVDSDELLLVYTDVTEEESEPVIINIGSIK